MLFAGKFLPSKRFMRLGLISLVVAICIISHDAFAEGDNSGSPPVIYGPCGMTFTAYAGHACNVQFYAVDPDPDESFSWSFWVPPWIYGSFSISSSGVLSFTPHALDCGYSFEFTVRVTDSEGNYDECDVTFLVFYPSWFDIEIAKIDSQLQGVHAHVPVKKTMGTEEIWGWDFLIGYDQSALSFVTANPGPLFDIPGDYEWEYFTFRYNYNGGCGSGCPSGLIRTVAMADMNDGGHHPDNVLIYDGMTLFALDFLVSNDRRLECQFVPINFYWMDCGDNTIAFRNRAGDPYDILTAVSEHVYWYDGHEEVPAFPYFEVTDSLSGFPTYTGVQNFCLEPEEPDKPTAFPFNRFYGGGIRIICADEIDARGDVNLNGVPNEIADAVVFTNYFVYSLAVFEINIDGQIAATDVNADGITLTIADLVYLIRIIIGDALPLDQMDLSPIAAKLIAQQDEKRIEGNVGAARFVFEGDVEVELGQGAAGMDIRRYFDGNVTRVIVYGFEAGRCASGEILRTSGKLLYAEAADYYGRPYNLRLQQLQPRGFTVRNYPNPFNSRAIIELSLPAAGDYTVNIFDMLGQKVAGFSGRGTAGEICRIEWDASELASGIYYCRAEACGFAEVRKMMLLK